MQKVIKAIKDCVAAKTCCEETGVDCNQGRNCPVREGTHTPAEAVHQIQEPTVNQQLTVEAAPVQLPEHVYTLRIRGRLHDHTPALPAFDLEDGEHKLYTEQQVRALLATASAETEPFGYFKAEPFGWTDCGPDDEGAVALYEKPQVLAIGGQAQAEKVGEQWS